MTNNTTNQQLKNDLIGKAAVSFILGIISIINSLVQLIMFSIPRMRVLNEVLEAYIIVLSEVLYHLFPLGLLNLPLFIFLTSILGLILGIMSLKSKPRRRLTLSLAIGGIIFSLIGLTLGLLLLPIVLYLGSGP
jgi:uncharacterized membrane protein YfcA